MKKYNTTASCVILCLLMLFLSSCANPLNRATYERYKQQGIVAENAGDAEAAHIAYYRAAENVRWGNLGPELESESLYNLGRMKRLVGQLDESAILLERTLLIDEKLYGPENPYLLPLLAELAMTYQEQKQFDKGIPVLDRMEPMLPILTEREDWQSRVFIGAVYSFYAVALENIDGKQADKFNAIAQSLKEK